MLIKAQPQNVTEYTDFAYNLALDQTKSCYPTYADGIKTKETSSLLPSGISIGRTLNYCCFYWITRLRAGSAISGSRKISICN